MKLALNVKNTSRAINPKANDVIIYDGKDWYITTKESLFEEEVKLLSKCEESLKNMRKEQDDFKKDVASQLIEMSELIKKLYSK